jgi:hypothetical protein
MLQRVVHSSESMRGVLGYADRIAPCPTS